jgi:hypothetical protein
MHDDELDARLKSADRMTGVSITGEALDKAFSDAREQAQRRRRLRVVVLAGSVAVALGGGAIAAPAVADTIRDWLAVAAWQPEPGGEILDSEMVDLSAPDLPAYIASRFPEWLPIPPGATREQLIEDVVERWQGVPEAGFTQEVAFRESFESLAYCGWVDAWLTSGEPATTARATEVLREAIDWPAFTQTDGGGRREFLTAYAIAAEAGDHDGIQVAAWQYGCGAFDGDPRPWWFEQNEWLRQNDGRE